MILRSTSFSPPPHIDAKNVRFSLLNTPESWRGRPHHKQKKDSAITVSHALLLTQSLPSPFPLYLNQPNTSTQSSKLPKTMKTSETCKILHFSNAYRSTTLTMQIWHQFLGPRLKRIHIKNRH